MRVKEEIIRVLEISEHDKRRILGLDCCIGCNCIGSTCKGCSMEPEKGVDDSKRAKVLSEELQRAFSLGISVGKQQ